jgi:hypothetical protein
MPRHKFAILDNRAPLQNIQIDNIILFQFLALFRTNETSEIGHQLVAKMPGRVQWDLGWKDVDGHDLNPRQVGWVVSWSRCEEWIVDCRGFGNKFEATL